MEFPHLFLRRFRTLLLVSLHQCAMAQDSGSSKFPVMFVLLDIIGLVAIILLFIFLLRKYNDYKNLIEQYVENNKDRNRSYDGYRLEGEKSSVISIESQSKFIVPADEEKAKLIFVDNEPFFDLNDLLKASAAGLGKGIFGNTYKAMMEGRAEVVVKRLRDLKPLSDEEFRRKLHGIAELRHPSLLPLLAYYNSSDEKLLMYRYAEKGNLFNRIHEGRGADRIPFSWSARLSAARGVARALEFLHTSKKAQRLAVPHGNLKSTNVLIDENDRILVSDFGLDSLVAHPIASQQMVAYKSPEYQTSKTVTKKSDVWSYGCLLLELLTGRVASLSAPPGSNGVDLCSWIQRAIREEWTAAIFDTELAAKRGSVPGMLKLLQLAIRCCDKYPEKRPQMTEVAREVGNINVVESGDEDDESGDQSFTDGSASASASNCAAGRVSSER